MPVLLPVLMLGVAATAVGVLTLPSSGAYAMTSASGVTALGPTARAEPRTHGPLSEEMPFAATATGVPVPTEAPSAPSGMLALAGLSTGAASAAFVVPPEATTSPLARSRVEAPALATPRTTDDGRQVLGSKAAMIAAAAPSVVTPIVGTVTSPFGYRWGRLHAGMDFGVPVGSPVLAAMDGVVQRTSSSRGGYGNLTVLEHADGTLTFYAHQSTILVADGQAVTAGETIGLSGNSGHSTGPHLHFEVRPGGGDPVDPRAWLTAQGVTL